MYLYRQYVNAFTASQAGTLIILVAQAEIKVNNIQELYKIKLRVGKNRNINCLLFYNAVLYFLYVANKIGETMNGMLLLTGILTTLVRVTNFAFNIV